MDACAGRLRFAIRPKPVTSWREMTKNWFVAWPVKIGPDVVAGWERDMPVGVKLHHPEDLVITLALLGKYDATQEKKLTSLLRHLAIQSPDIKLGTAIPLPQPRRFSMLAWTLADGRLEIEKLIAKYRPRICRDLGAFIDASPEVPAIAFARPERKITNDDRDRILSWADSATAPADRFQLGAPAIFRWSTHAGDRQFEQVE